MKCPKCSSEITEGKVHGEAAHKCVKCGGIWLETGELRSFFERMLDNNPKYKPKKKAKSDVPLAGTFYKTGRDCPECGQQMEKTYFAYDSGIPIEHCVPCGGTWVDKPQINQLAAYLQDNSEPLVFSGGEPVEHSYKEMLAADPRLAWLRPVLAIIVAVICAIALIHASRILYFRADADRAARDSLNWVAIDGTLEETVVHSSSSGFAGLGGTVYSIRKNYTYSFLGTTYEAHAVWPNGDDLMTRDASRAAMSRLFFEPSAKLTVYIDPENPDRACLAQGVNPFRKRHRPAVLIVQIVISGLGVLVAAWTLFRWRYPAD